MKKSLVVLLLAVIGLTVLISGCGANKTTTSQNSDRASQELKKFNVGYLSSTGHILYFIAQEKGYFKEEGLDVHLFQFNNSGEGINAIIAGKLDAGSFGTAPPLTFIAKGTDLTIFGGQMTEGHAVIVKPEHADQFKDLANFKGKTIATVRLSTGDIVFRGSFTQTGIDWQKDVTIQELESPAAVLEAVKKGTADGGIVWTPYRKMAQDQGLAIVKYSGEVMPDHPCCRQIALTKSIQANPEDYEKLEAALIKAYKFYQTNHSESIDILAKYVNVEKSILEAETYGEHISSNPDPNRQGVIEFWDFMEQIGYIDSDIDISNHVNTTVYKNALQSVLDRDPNDEIYKKLQADFKE